MPAPTTRPWRANRAIAISRLIAERKHIKQKAEYINGEVGKLMANITAKRGF